MKWPLLNKAPTIPKEGAVGDFAFRRSFYFHPGVDVYCDFGQAIVAIEEGTVVHIENFTGPSAHPPSPWWMETWSILIEGKSGVLGYCEIKPLPHIKVGAKIKEGELIANVIPVLKKDKGNGTTMLHFEHYVAGTKHHVTWKLDTIKPDELLNSRLLLEKLLPID
jgi:murein DD-endopeptidase MepM/ murein hydrolase activator NlpD